MGLALELFAICRKREVESIALVKGRQISILHYLLTNAIPSHIST